jgi:hypothetical protein
MTNVLIAAINELMTVKTVNEWNKVRAQYVDRLTREELYKIDGEGLIVKVLGRDKY